MERDRLICCLVGKYATIQPSITPEDLRIKIDNHLIECRLTPLGTEKNDEELLQELVDEIAMSVLGMGINRKMRRNV